MATALCRKEIPSNLRLSRDPKVPRQPTSQKRLANRISTYPAGGARPSAGLLHFQGKRDPPPPLHEFRLPGLIIVPLWTTNKSPASSAKPRISSKSTELSSAATAATKKPLNLSTASLNPSPRW